MGSADEAINQVFEKKYYEPYRLKKKEIILLGIGFSREERNISGFKHMAFAAGERISQGKKLSKKQEIWYH